ncbi:hypothetical protein LOD99_14246 [Oopsacas minuta]|uniref:Uncharacterized protein n=1 Tax=Oopsacas minuta TaxID=111878 RepID=A0AAV7KIY8_9METZ|nr:hypothetical protein LOD99_14246 [Oopsacas minuta]
MNTSRRQCTNHPDNFCYICGKFTLKPQRRNITNRVKIGYKYYFGCKVGDQDKNWAPHICCTVCYASLIQWLNGKKKSMPFAVPMIWREPKNHTSDCYFCTTNIAGFSPKNKSKIIYPTCKSALKPVEHDAGNGIPVPIPPSSDTIEMDSTDEVDVADADSTSDFSDHDENDKMIPMDQAFLNDLVRDLSHSKEKAELLGSRLKELNLLKPGTTISHFRRRHANVSAYFKFEDCVCFCTDIDSLMYELGHEHISTEWRLFIDSSKASLKAVLLHNGNEKPSVPIAHAVGLKETYESMETILGVIDYWAHNWNICGDLKVVSLLLGCSWVTPSICVFSVCGTVETRQTTMTQPNGQ